ncbi:aldehyde dehydrogenase family protein [Nocardioides aquiterrae]|uniref:Aldehyde dehydrogenase n=1 Tax=Nocardioides aquiterrae TaxID=203799 RepID=A0ABN1UDH6_9ACTN
MTDTLLPGISSADHPFLHEEVFGVAGGQLRGHVPLYVNGAFVTPGHGGSRRLINPATGHDLGTVVEADAADVAAAVEAAETAFRSGIWSRASSRDRAIVLNRLAALIDEYMQQIFTLETLGNGRPTRETQAQLSLLGDYYRYAASLLLTRRSEVMPSSGHHHIYTHRSPVGVCAIITPFNHPMLILAGSLAFALANGNSVVVKPSEFTPVTTVLLAALAVEAGLPPGVFNVVTGGAEVSAALVSDVRVAKVNFTGGTRGGLAMAELTANRPTKLTMELGGHTPVVVFDDADLDSAVNGVTFASFIAAGQTCIAASVILVQSGIHDEFVERLRSKAESLRIGDPLSEETDLGPVISADRRAAVIDATERAVAQGARLVTGGGAAEPGSSAHADGFYVRPTILAGASPGMEIFDEEVFGPFVVIARFDDEQEAIEMANGSRYALGAAVWTESVGRAHRVAQRLDSGICWVNDHHRLEVSVPWGGYKLSGTGKEAGVEAFDDFSHQRAVIVRTEESPDWYTSSGQRLN